MGELIPILAMTFVLGPIATLAFSYTPLGRALVERLRGRGRPQDDMLVDLHDEIERLRDHIAAQEQQFDELHERVDFAERILLRGQALRIGPVESSRQFEKSKPPGGGVRRRLPGIHGMPFNAEFLSQALEVPSDSVENRHTDAANDGKDKADSRHGPQRLLLGNRRGIEGNCNDRDDGQDDSVALCAPCERLWQIHIPMSENHKARPLRHVRAPEVRVV